MSPNPESSGPGGGQERSDAARVIDHSMHREGLVGYVREFLE